MRKIVVAVPAYQGIIYVPTAMHLFELQDEVAENGWQIALITRITDADIVRARNALLALFLDSSATDLLFLDADVAAGRGHFTQLMNHDKDFVCGLYRKRTDEGEIYPVDWYEPRQLDTSNGAPLLRAKRVPAGYMRLSRRCVERMCENLGPGEWFYDSMINKRVPWLFDWHFKDGQRLGEDLYFCDRWTSIGGEIWVDPTIPLSHTGLKKFEGNIGDYLQREAMKTFRPTPNGPTAMKDMVEMLIASA